MIIDIDNFGNINKKYGYKTGNAVLEAFDLHTKEWINKRGYVLNRSGDEIIAIYKLNGSIDSLLKHLKFLLSKPLKVNIQKDFIKEITISIGISINDVEKLSIEESIRRSDVALFNAKKSGKNQYKFYHDQMDEETLRNIDLADQMTSAIENRHFEMFYQPVVCANSEKIVGFEALIRWNHPERGLVSPNEFIKIAENSGKILALEKWIVETVFSQIKIWSLQRPNILVSINLSSKGLLQKDLFETLIAYAKHYKINPASVIIEVTESSLIHNFESSVKKLKKIADHGFKVALDDFGTGYSSLNYLRQLPVTKVKLDKSFVDIIEQSEKDRILVDSIVKLAHGLDLKIVVEGIERLEQLKLIKEMKCDYYQGYYYYKPMSVQQLSSIPLSMV